MARNTTRRREAGEASRRETTRLLLEAAGEEFAERGYAAATVTRIAERAGVSVQTLYLAWGSKRALLRGFMEVSLTGSPTGIQDEGPAAVYAAHAPDTEPEDPRAFIADLTRFFRGLCERAGLGWQLYRDAAALDPELAEDWQALQMARREGIGALIARIPAEALRPGLTTAAAGDTAWVIASPDTYDLLVGRGGYTLDDYAAWIQRTVEHALLPDRSPPASH